jgi:hypothetical protein
MNPGRPEIPAEWLSFHRSIAAKVSNSAKSMMLSTPSQALDDLHDFLPTNQTESMTTNIHVVTSLRTNPTSNELGAPTFVIPGAWLHAGTGMVPDNCSNHDVENPGRYAFLTAKKGPLPPEIPSQADLDGEYHLELGLLMLG